MPIVVVAVLQAKAGLAENVLDSFRVVSPFVHKEKGCELYAAHTNGTVVITIECWATRADLNVYAGVRRSPALTNRTRNRQPYDDWFLDGVPLGTPLPGVICMSKGVRLCFPASCSLDPRRGGVRLSVSNGAYCNFVLRIGRATGEVERG